jgi:hypothetical protein
MFKQKHATHLEDACGQTLEGNPGQPVIQGVANEAKVSFSRIPPGPTLSD